jgi:hypothetical protein
LPKFFVRLSDGLPQFLGVPDLPAAHCVAVVGDQVCPLGELCPLLVGRLVSVEGGFFGEVPAFPALDHPQCSCLAGAGPAHRLDGGAAGHGHIPQFAGVRVADFHGEWAYAHSVLIGDRRHDIGG